MSSVLPVWTLLTWVLLVILFLKVLYLEKLAKIFRKSFGIDPPATEAKNWLSRTWRRVSEPFRSL